MDGRESTAPQEGPLRYEWTFLSQPPGSEASLDDTSSPTPRFTADVAGPYRLRLVVTDDGSRRSPPDEVVVTALSNGSRLPDTGQETCYGLSARISFPLPGDPYEGQDGQYVTNPMQLWDNGSVVHDNVTGLDWQKGEHAGTYNWYEATGTLHGTYNPSGETDACGDLVLGGWSDWRLPSRHELASILDLGGASPAIDNSRFPGAWREPYWSATEAGTAVSPLPAWSVDFDNGAIAAEPKTLDRRVRCVRGEERRPVLVENLDGTVTDCTTLLAWQQGAASARSWGSALAYCEGLILGGALGHSDWRLPNAKELESLVRIGADNGTGPPPTIDGALLPAPGRFWSSTSRVEGEGAGTAWTVDFNTGAMDDRGGGKAAASNYVRCVR
jgi:hypothetical protein